MKKNISLMLVLVMIVGILAGCGKTAPAAETKAPAGAAPAAEAPAAEAPAERTYKAAFITSTARGNEFIDLIWSGFQKLEAEGWEVKCIECFETAEQAEQAYAMCEAGYDLIYTQGDDVKVSIEDLNLAEQYPDTYFLYLDTYEEPQMEHATSVTIDPFESCFIAGYLTALTTQKDVIGVMLPMDTPIMRRFEYGYYAGIEYANAENGTSKTWVKGYTNSWNDTTKGYEAAVAMNSNNDIDTIIHCAYISGYGVISACADLDLRCVGVDGWQGYINPCVFWSAIKSMDVAVLKTAHALTSGETLPAHVEYSVSSGGEAYYEPDLDNLPADVAEKVVVLKDKITSGEVDVFSGAYEEYRTTSN